MKLPKLHIGNLTAAYPIIQGGMGVGISLGNLAGTVAAEGGVGIISTAQIGFREPDFDTDTTAANARAIQKEYDKARTISPDGIIGFNIMVALRDYKEHVRAAVRTGADLIISGAGLPTGLPDLVKGSDVKIAPIVSSAKSAKVILKYWDQKYDRCADLVIVEGPAAGGHLGFTTDQLETYAQTPDLFDEEIQEIRQVLDGYRQRYKREIPLVLAGGICTHEDVCRALKKGADGVQVATRFVTTEECDADIRYKQAYIQARKEDIIIVKSPVGLPGRAILNPFMKRVKVERKIEHSPCHGCLAKCSPNDIPYCITDGLVNAAKGDVDHALLFCGTGAYRATKIETVRDVMASLIG